jgi:hypothetical protein
MWPEPTNVTRIQPAAVYRHPTGVGTSLLAARPSSYDVIGRRTTVLQGSDKATIRQRRRNASATPCEHMSDTATPRGAFDRANGELMRGAHLTHELSCKPWSVTAAQSDR